jgi:hypothetical protein
VKGIIMSAESVRAIIDNRKSQTRRVVKPQPERVWGQGVRRDDPEHFSAHVRFPNGNQPDPWIRCPYGKPGDVLYCKEPFALLNDIQSGTAALYRDCDGQGIPIAYREAHEGSVKVSRWRSPIFMPRAAARLKIVLTEVRVQRLQDISEDDAIAEGMAIDDAVHDYSRLWDSINAKRGYPWESNPFVFVLGFKKVEDA